MQWLKVIKWIWMIRTDTSATSTKQKYTIRIFGSTSTYEKFRKKSIVLFNSNWTVKLNYLQSCHKMPTGNQDIILPC